MKKIHTLIAVAATLALISCKEGNKADTTTSHQDTSAVMKEAEKAPEKPKMDSAAEAKAWMDYMTPGSMHQWLAAQDGKWKGEQIAYNPDGSATPPAEVTAEIKTVLGGRYQEAVYKGNMMGMPFEGHGTTAYDNARKKFISTWIDNMGTGLMYCEGTLDEKSGVLSVTGKMTDPTSGVDTDVRQTFKMADQSSIIMEMYCTKDGKEIKAMEIKMTKK